MILCITNREEVYGELENVLRLFFAMEPVRADSSEIPRLSVSHLAVLEGDRWIHEITIASEGKSRQWRTEYPAREESRLLSLRWLRRGAKLALYRALQDAFPKELPWGSLTGIRPTKLLRQLREEEGGAEAASRRLMDEMDVSPEKTGLLEEILEAQEGLYRYGRDEESDVYIGIPFCKTRCLYCSFLSADLSHPSARRWLDPYTDTLIRDVRRAGELLERTGKKPNAVYMGGGTPSVLGTDRLRRVLREARKAFPGAVEWTVEAGRPDTMDNGMLPMLRDEGIERISINPQTMQQGTLDVIGRQHRVEEIVERLLEAESLGFGCVNVDLIMGLPGEGIREAESTFEALRPLPFQNVTVHTLAIKHSSRLHEKLEEYPLPDGETVAEMVDMGREFARSRGMRPYYLYRQKYMSGNLENVGYALPGTECLYNIDIMEETHSTVAAGAGGISKKMIFSENRHERFPNPKGIEVYLREFDSIMDRRDAFFESRENKDGSERH